MATPKGYNSYRGRGPILKVVAAVVLVLVILASAAFLLLQKYLVYDQSGRPHLELPASSSAAASPISGAASGAGSLNLTIDQPETPPSLRALALTPTPLTDWTAEQSRLDAAGLRAAVLTVKDAGGAVYYDSAAAKAVSSGAVKADPATAAAVAAMTGSDVYAVARLSCLRDPVAAKAKLDAMGLKNTGGYVFYDANNENWLDPAKTAARDYLAALAGECAALGFDELLLTDVSYPTAGKLNKIAYTGAAQLSENLDLLVQSVRAALADYPNVKLSVELPAAVITAGSDPAAGLVLSDIAASADRIYAAADAASVPALTDAVHAANAKTDFVAEAPDITAFTGSGLQSAGK